jgi:hypothetical protein
MIYYFLFTIVPALAGISALLINDRRLSILNFDIGKIAHWPLQTAAKDEQRKHN